ncbi:MAG: MSMEG_1061 family FMN-dependent PPOX-type flavoprotein [Gaiella sp.]
MSDLATRFSGLIDSLEELTAYHGSPGPVPQAKVIDHLDVHCRDFIARSPFFTLATADADGRCDVSPRGGPTGFVEVLGPKHLAFADAKGNRLADSMRNIVQTGRAGLLFLIPTLAETLRVNGRAVLTRDPDLLARHEVVEGKPPRIVIVLEVEEAFLHCAKAFIRSELWEPESWQPLEGLARAAQIWKDHAEIQAMSVGDLEDYLAEDYRDNLYWEPRDGTTSA